MSSGSSIKLHRRKSSKDSDENILIVSPPPEDRETEAPPLQQQPNGSHRPPSLTIVGPPPPPRNGTFSRPIRGHGRSASLANGLNGSSVASPLRNTFVAPQTNGVNGHQSSPSPYRVSFPGTSPTQSTHAFSHPRTRAVSANYSAIPSPLNGFPHSPDQPTAFPSSTTFPNFGPPRPPPSPGLLSVHSTDGLYHHAEDQQKSPVSPSSSYLAFDSSAFPPPSPLNPPSAATTAAHHKRRHSRMHSRNLSVFFPRPGALPHSAIDEDGDGQELEIPAEYEAPIATMPSAGSNVSVPGSRRYNRGGGNNPPLTPLGQGFKFGGRPPQSESDTPDDVLPADQQPSHPKRRGHHHKHSLSHNFFSFLEPASVAGSGDEAGLHTQPTPVPLSPWAPISAFPESAKPTGAAQGGGFPSVSTPVGVPAMNGKPNPVADEVAEIPPAAAATSLAQFVLGAWMWVAGQQIGSLSVTGLGYWIVFDAFGVAVAKVVPGWLASTSTSGSIQQQERMSIRRPYGNGRLETVLMFSQAVYLMFSSVYVCKETVEHLLLSAGGEGHHHHSGDEHPQTGIEFPVFMVLLTFGSLLATAFYYDNNSKLVNLSGNRLPSLQSLARLVQSKRNTHFIEPPPTHPFAVVLSNPYAACPLLFCVAILSIALALHPEQHRMADLALSSVIAILTFNVAYRACVVLGAVLLQTSPPRGLPSGKMESFLRAMREVERHPDVLHLPAPHIWQLTASAAAQKSKVSTGSIKNAISDQLVVTLEVHVRPDLPDDDVLALTKWTWERCVNALGGYKEFREVGEVGGPEITVGVVRG